MRLSKKDIIIKSWGLMSKKLPIITTMVLFIFSLIVLFTAVQDKLMVKLTYQSIVFIITSSLFNQGISLGLICVALKIINNNEVTFSLLFSGFHMLFQYVAASIIYFFILLVGAIPGAGMLLFSIYQGSAVNFSSIISMLGILLIIIPTIYLSVRLQFYNYFLIDQECGVVESIQKSAAITMGHVLELFIFGAYLSLIVLISLIPFSIGIAIGTPLVILLAVPVGLSFVFTIIALGYVYFILNKKSIP